MKSNLNSNLLAQVASVNSSTGGATLTQVARSHALKDLVSTCRGKLNIQVRDLRDLKPAHLQKYVTHAKEQGVGNRTLQNRLAHVRTALAQFKDPMANPKHSLTSNQALGIAGASRAGTHKAISADQVSQARAGLLASGQPGAAAALDLQRELGLRQREAIQSEKSLKSWERALERGDRVTVIHGTKGGRGRETGVVDTARALGAVRNALEVVKSQGGRLVPSQTLQGACRSYQRSLQAQGLTGELASHSLRCAYAQERFAQHLERIGDRREALAATSVDLGHGDGRGTYVAQVYLAN